MIGAAAGDRYGGGQCSQSWLAYLERPMSTPSSLANGDTIPRRPGR
jgi:hypothetical protein